MTILILTVVTALPGQTVQRASSNAPFHKDPRGIQLGRLQSGIRYVTGTAQNGWIEATIEGYIWARSVAPTTRDGFDLAVTAGGGEVVRTEPNGTVVARLVEGTLLRRLATQGGWIKAAHRVGGSARVGGGGSPRHDRAAAASTGGGILDQPAAALRRARPFAACAPGRRPDRHRLQQGARPGVAPGGAARWRPRPTVRGRVARPAHEVEERPASGSRSVSRWVGRRGRGGTTPRPSPGHGPGGA
ncbi:MAG: hypothetical protein R2909_02350 [Gemmatimonadales bacterium]